MSWQTLNPDTRQAAEQILTPRQLTILRDRLNGHSWRTIARAHDIHEATVRGHWNAALDRMHRHRDELRKAAA